jgi:hypothetical protein
MLLKAASRNPQWLKRMKGCRGLVSGARFPTVVSTRGCHWFRRLLAGHELCHIPLNGLNSSLHSRMPLDGIPLGCSVPLTVATVNSVQMLKAGQVWQVGQRECDCIGYHEVRRGSGTVRVFRRQ